MRRHFNPRARVGRDVALPRPFADPHAISIHAPAWGATAFDFALFVALVISIHAPAWGATTLKSCISTSFLFQSTRPRGARRPCKSGLSRFHVISIHAPAWGATIDVMLKMKAVFKQISIHAPAWGATGWRRSDGSGRRISIHAPAWGATEELLAMEKSEEISIHAPAWGATVYRNMSRMTSHDFNPRARVGRDCFFS